MEENTTKKRLPTWLKIGIAVVGLAVLGKAMDILTTSPEQVQAAEAAKIERAELRLKEESDKALADTLLRLQIVSEQYLKKNLKDPESFEVIDHSEYRVNDPEPSIHYQASVRYRAKNSFGGFVVEKKCFNYSQEGSLTEVFDCK